MGQGRVAAHLDPGSEVSAAAELFKALASPLRVELLLHLEEPTTVSALVVLVGATQPLVSQHLRVLRMAGLVTVTRRGREAFYRVADEHVGHVVRDAVTHATEPPGHAAAAAQRPETPDLS